MATSGPLGFLESRLSMSGGRRRSTLRALERIRRKGNIQPDDGARGDAAAVRHSVRTGSLAEVGQRLMHGASGTSHSQSSSH